MVTTIVFDVFVCMKSAAGISVPINEIVTLVHTFAVVLRVYNQSVYILSSGFHMLCVVTSLIFWVGCRFVPGFGVFVYTE